MFGYVVPLSYIHRFQLGGRAMCDPCKPFSPSGTGLCCSVYIVFPFCCALKSKTLYILGIEMGSDWIFNLNIDNTDHLAICSLITTKCENNRKCFLLL